MTGAACDSYFGQGIEQAAEATYLLSQPILSDPSPSYGLAPPWQMKRTLVQTTARIDGPNPKAWSGYVGIPALTALRQLIR